MFEVGSYISDKGQILETPEMVVLAYVKAFQLWSKDCHQWLKANSNDLTKLSRLGARDVLIALRQQYCVSKNRRYERSAGHYWVGGAADVEPTIERVEQIDSSKVHVFTAANKQRHRKAYRFILRRVGSQWKIENLASSSGPDNWQDVAL